VAAARTFVTGHLIQNGLLSEVETVGLVISELATNAVIHAGTPFTVTLGRSNGTLSVAVRDLSFGRPQSLPPGRGLDEGGRGLAVIAALSSTWGITALSDGKLVWATFDLADAPGRRANPGKSP
jgi:anti-sigma regulatory factor (Ser/Thr protein kinase)